VIREYLMSIKPRREGDPFPKSRRVAILVQRQADGRLLVTPARPLGWVLVELEKAA
jgi:CRISPR-associated protein Csm5